LAHRPRPDPPADVSEAITRSALERKESRGRHFRDDYPQRTRAFAKFNVVTYKGQDGSMQLRREPLQEMPTELKAVTRKTPRMRSELLAENLGRLF